MAEGFDDAVLEQGDHAFFGGGLLNGERSGDGIVVGDEIFDGGSDFELFADTETALEAKVVTDIAANSFGEADFFERRVGVFGQAAEGVFDFCQLGFGGWVGGFAGGAETPDKALGDDEFYGAGEEGILANHIHEPGNGCS